MPGEGKSGWEVVFHGGQLSRPLAVAICAGAAHSACVDSAGAVLAWRSADPGLHVQQVAGALMHKRVVAVSAGWLSAPPDANSASCSVAWPGQECCSEVTWTLGQLSTNTLQQNTCLGVGRSAGKYRTAAVTEEGDVYMWEGWSKPAEAGIGSGAHVSGGKEYAGAGACNSSTAGSAAAGGPRSDCWEGGFATAPDAASSRRGRKHDRARTFEHQRILPERRARTHLPVPHQKSPLAVMSPSVLQHCDCCLASLHGSKGCFLHADCRAQWQLQL